MKWINGWNESMDEMNQWMKIFNEWNESVK